MNSSLPSDNPCILNANKCYTDLLQLIASFEKGSTAEVSSKLRAIESAIENLRESVEQIADVSTNEHKQKAAIKDLYRQIKLKNELIDTFINYDTVDGVKRTLRLYTVINFFHFKGSKNNETHIVCSFCKTKILSPQIASWIDKTQSLPLARQKKDAATMETELISGFWSVVDVMDFDNVGVTNSVEGIRYLSCAECDYGPIGVIEAETKLHLIAPQRVADN